MKTKTFQIFYTIAIFVLTTLVNLFIISGCKVLNLHILQYILPSVNVFLLTVCAWYNVKYYNLYKANVNDKTTELSKKVRRALYAFLEYSDTLNKYKNMLGITDIKAWETKINFPWEKEKTIIHVEITLERPGLLIGRAGTVIDACTEYLEVQLENQVQIHIEESKLWRNLYK